MTSTTIMRKSGNEYEVDYMKAAPKRNNKRKKRVEALKKKSKAPTIKGSITDKRFPGTRLADASFADKFGLLLHDKVTQPLSIRYDASTGEVRCLVLRMPDGLDVGWGNCGVCHLFVQDCECKHGTMEPYYITNMYLRIEAEMKGEKPPTEVDLRKRGIAGKPVMPTTSFKGKPSSTKVKAKTTKGKSGKKVVRRGGTPNVKVDTSDIDSLDLKQLEKDADASTKDMLSKVEQTMKNKGKGKKKVVRKKTTSKPTAKKATKKVVKKKGRK